MLLNGSLNIVTDLNVAIMASTNSRVLFIGELNNRLPNTIIPCSILLPPYEAINAEINGDINAYRNSYISYLGLDRNCFEMFATILVALHQGINITLYIENAEMMHYQFLIDYLKGTYGITPGTEINQYQYDSNYDASNGSILISFMDGFISAEEYLNCIDNDINILLSMESIPYVLDIPELILCDRYNIPKENLELRRSMLNNILVRRKNIYIRGPLVTIES